MGAGTVSRNRWGSHRGVREGPALRGPPGPAGPGMEVRFGLANGRLSRSRMGFGALLSLGTLLATYTPDKPGRQKTGVDSSSD